MSFNSYNIFRFIKMRLKFACTAVASCFMVLRSAFFIIVSIVVLMSA